MQNITRKQALDHLANGRFIAWEHPIYDTQVFVLSEALIEKHDEDGLRLLDEYDLFKLIMDERIKNQDLILQLQDIKDSMRRGF